jgi:hypothetical protein
MPLGARTPARHDYEKVDQGGDDVPHDRTPLLIRRDRSGFLFQPDFTGS